MAEPLETPSGGAAPPAPEPADGRSGYPLFLGGIGTWFGAWGIQTVLMQWLVVEELGESAERLGTLQMATLLPSLFFLLVGGVLGDRVDRRRSLVLLHGLAALAAACLAALLWAGVLSFGLLIGFALFVGTLQAFVVPIRDAQLSEVVRFDMSRAVAGMTMVQHTGQGLGALLAGLARFAGAPSVFALQAAIAFLGAVAMSRLPRGTPRPVETRASLRLADVQQGLRDVLHSPVLRVLVVVNVSVGIIFVGTYLVLLPLLVSELYGGGPDRMGLLIGILPGGSILANSAIIARGGVHWQGRSLLLGQGFAGLCLGALAFGLPFFGAALAVFGWGLGAAFAINASRTLFQEHAPEATRGRVLSIYSLSILGTGPLGALLTGLLAGWIGTLATLGLYSIAMTAILIVVFLVTGVSRFR